MIIVPRLGSSTSFLKTNIKFICLVARWPMSGIWYRLVFIEKPSATVPTEAKTNTRLWTARRRHILFLLLSPLTWLGSPMGISSTIVLGEEICDYYTTIFFVEIDDLLPQIIFCFAAKTYPVSRRQFLSALIVVHLVRNKLYAMHSRWHWAYRSHSCTQSFR